MLHIIGKWTPIHTPMAEPLYAEEILKPSEANLEFVVPGYIIAMDLTLVYDQQPANLMKFPPTSAALYVHC